MSTDLQKTFRLSRKDASQILKVSTRTLDRYIIKKTLSTKNIAGRIFLSEEEVVEFVKEKRRKKRRKPAIRKTTKLQSKLQSKSQIVSHERDEKVYNLDVSVNNEIEKSENIIKENGSNIPVEIYDLPIEKPAEYEILDAGTFDVEIDSMPDISEINQNFEQVVDQGEGQTVEGETSSQEYIDVVAKADELVYKNLYEEQKEEVRSFQRRLEGANYRVGQLESQIKESVPLLDHQKLLTGHKKEVLNKKILYILLAVLLFAQPIWMILAFI
jgi:hypothetical protein